jgi:TolB protein
VSRTVLLSVSVVLALLAACVAALVVASMKPAEAAFPGRNGDIAFVRSREYPAMGTDIYRMHPDGTGVERLARGFTPAFSPNGKLIAFSSERNAGSGIYLMRAAGSNQTRLTNDGGADPAWVPRARTLIYSATETAGNTDLYAVSFDAAFKPTGPPTRLTTDPAYDVTPAVSPDGKKVVFFSYRDVPDDIGGGGGGLYVMDVGRPEGEDNEPILLSNSIESDFMDRYPNWSPDGSKIIYSRQPDPEGGEFADIWIMNSDGTRKKSLTPNSPYYHDSHPAFSPDGRKVVFHRHYEEERGSRVWRMNADGSNRTQLTRNATIDYDPDWQPRP